METVRSERSLGRQRPLNGHRSTAEDDVQEVIDGLVEQVALINCSGIIVAVNKCWRRQVERQSRHGLRISRDYTRFLADLIESGDTGAIPILQAFREIAAGTRRSFHCVYKGTGAFAGYDFNVTISALRVHDTRHVLVSVHDVTELVALKRQRRRAGSELLQAQEDERRRIARELHDSTSQNLVSLQLDLSRLSREPSGPAVDDIVADCRKIVRDMQQEIRAISFLAHPPSLTRTSLALALEHLVNGFAHRTGLQIEVDVERAGEISASVEAAIYRVSQEALANIHRHAGATRAAFRLVARDRYLHLLIRDDGTGFDSGPHSPQRLGVGVSGMKERVRELGGRMSIGHTKPGTALRVTFPRQKRMVFVPTIGAG